MRRRGRTDRNCRTKVESVSRRGSLTALIRHDPPLICHVLAPRAFSRVRATRRRGRLVHVASVRAPIRDRRRPRGRAIGRFFGPSDTPTSYHGGVRSTRTRPFSSRGTTRFLTPLAGRWRRHAPDVYRQLYSRPSPLARRGVPAIGVRRFPVPSLIAASVACSRCFVARMWRVYHGFMENFWILDLLNQKREHKS